MCQSFSGTLCSKLENSEIVGSYVFTTGAEESHLWERNRGEMEDFCPNLDSLLKYSVVQLHLSSFSIIYSNNLIELNEFPFNPSY